MTAPERADLTRPRDLSALLSDATVLYLRNFWRLLAVAVAIVIPVDAIVLGLGLGQFTGGFDSTPEVATDVIQALVRFLVTGPLVAVAVMHALHEMAEGRRPRVRASIQAALDAFPAVFWPMLVAAACIALTVWFFVGLVLLVRWYLVPLVVVEQREARGPRAALSAGWDLTRGAGLRTAGIVVVSVVLFSLAGGLVATPLLALAQSADSEAIGLAATALLETVIAAPVALVAGLLYFDLRVRRAAAART